MFQNSRRACKQATCGGAARKSRTALSSIHGSGLSSLSKMRVYSPRAWASPKSHAAGLVPGAPGTVTSAVAYGGSSIRSAAGAPSAAPSICWVRLSQCSTSSRICSRSCRVLQIGHRLQQRPQDVQLLLGIRQQDGERRQAGVGDAGQRAGFPVRVPVRGDREQHLESHEEEIEDLAGGHDRDQAGVPAPVVSLDPEAGHDRGQHGLLRSGQDGGRRVAFHRPAGGVLRHVFSPHVSDAGRRGDWASRCATWWVA